MKSRLALIVVLALGVFMSGTGATLAVNGIASSGSASSAQYPEEERSGTEHAFEEHHNECVNGHGGSGNCSHYCNGANSCSNITGCEGTSTGSCAQPAEQVATGGGGSLPFTGFLAIPVLIIGLGLLGAGVAMRLRMRSGNDDRPYVNWPDA